MPTIRKKSPQRRANYDRLPEAYERYLLHGENPAENQDIEGCFDCFVDMRSPRMREIWEGARERLLTEWVKQSPGTRPHGWWLFDAPEPRLRIGGTGTPAHEVLNYVPCFRFGIPERFVSRFEEEYYNGRARDIHGNKVGGHKEGDFSGVAVDPEDPPVYESQAEYLRQHGLFLSGEKKRLKAAHFEPEKISEE